MSYIELIEGVKVRKFAVLCLLLFLIVAIPSLAQNTRGTLGVTHFEQAYTFDGLFKSLARSKSDTARVGMLIKISSLYWRKGQSTAEDSCIYFAKEAYALSRKLNFSEGSNEGIFLECKAFTKDNNIQSAKALLGTVYGEMRIRLLLVIAEYYVFLPEQQQANLQKALPFMISARKLCDSIHSVFWRQYYLLLFAKYYFEQGAYDQGKSTMLEIVADFEKTGDIEEQAHYWSELGLYLPLSNNAYKDKIHSHEMAYSLFMRAKKTKDAIFSLRDMANTNMIYGHMDLAEKQILRVLALCRSTNIAPSFYTYYLAALIFTYNGDLNRGLSYLIMAIKISDTSNQYQTMDAYQLMADIYYAQGSYSKSLYYNKMVLDYCRSIHSFSTYTFCHKIVLNQIALGQTKSAFIFLSAYRRQHPPVYLNDQVAMALSFGNIYHALKNYGEAEKYYLQTIITDKKLEPEINKRLEQIHDNVRINSTEVYFTLGRFYVERKRYKEAKSYLIHAYHSEANAFKNNNAQFPVIAGQGEIEFNFYKVDSAAGKYISALQHYRRYQFLKDSVSDITRNRGFEELQLQYETKEKEQSIKLLQSQGLRKDAELQKLNSQRKLIFGGIATSIIIAILACTAFLNKRNSNYQLKLKQEKINVQNEEIHEKNLSLQHLVNDKDELIREKETLLKEVNHRVKNNLQMVMSLLNKQLSFLNNSAAISAIRESKNRIQAMAIIHQKFYNASTIGTVDIKEYVFELARYLTYSFNINKRQIQIKRVIEVERLDISQAVPLGLILNEAITNSIKHAFPTGMGIINISLLQMENEIACLSISDNGKGLPKNFKVKKGNSMGMELLVVLSKQLGGSLEIKNENGLTIVTRFKVFNHPQIDPVETFDVT